MLFSSITFIFIFLPTVLAVYYILPMRAKNLWLLAASLFFYFYGEPKYLILMLAVIASSYVFGLITERAKGKARKAALSMSVIISLSFLIFFKYTDFFILTTNSLFGSSLDPLRLALPIGISFYTFQAISYNIDVYRGDTPAQKNIINLALYISLFPQLVAGPIVRYTDIARELKNRRCTLDGFSCGARRFVIGLSKKVLFANTFGTLCETFRASDDKSVLFFWIYAVAFTLQIYFDFSGYSDMAIGLGRMFGFSFPENFRYPFISKSVTEFWRRWHISLGSWFRDYVYIPMGGNRVSKPRFFFNILTVWFLTGFWHGADWNFIIWGLYFAALLLAEKSIPAKIKDKVPPIISHAYLMLVVVIGFVIFNADGIGSAAADLAGMFSGKYPLYSETALYYLRSYLIPLAIGAVGSTPIIKTAGEKLVSGRLGSKAAVILEPVFILILLTAASAYLIDGSYNPFLYFRF
ncbi:MAG: MBOAT family O-acyltransferase [Oscillospiraceae bacterium]|nr:MBOAT family O-acyltransferase [Oscillospiraceae bacterium]